MNKVIPSVQWSDIPNDLGERIEWARRTPYPEDMPGRRVEWLGEKSPFEEPFVEFAISTNLFNPEQVAVIRHEALKREARWVGAERHISAEDARVRLSRDYLWHRANKWICRMSYADAEAILSSIDGHQFLDLDAHEPDAPKILYPPMNIRVVSEQAFKYGESTARGRSLIQSLGPR